MGNFANVFKSLRIARGYTQEGIAAALGVSRSAVSMYESGKRVPDSDDLEKFADFFNVDVDYLIGRSKQSTYYINPETADVAQQIFENSKMRILFDAAKDADPEDLQMAADMLYRLKAKTLNLDDGGC